MKDIPKSALKWYKMWIIQHPENWHPTSLDFFYIFVHILVSNSKKDRSSEWLRQNLKDDCPQLSSKDVKKYCCIYEHLKNFKKVHKSQTAKLIARSEFKKAMKEARKKYAKK